MARHRSITVREFFKVHKFEGRAKLEGTHADPVVWLALVDATWPNFALCFDRLDQIFEVDPDSTIKDVRSLAHGIMRCHTAYRVYRKRGDAVLKATA